MLREVASFYLGNKKTTYEKFMQAVNKKFKS